MEELKGTIQENKKSMIYAKKLSVGSNGIGYV